ncbi:hypothetical protein [Rhizobium viscosum]|uniref:Uncharacterized protein n=1 Tax=Rhizobium viscosum TaxID=1673 RepID=A0ABR9IRH8_RHIVS|nr:hypothetical protein [Rhizobium viscosum]MBE1505798.1 hypothetical protein [Rhizobium viscosum]
MTASFLAHFQTQRSAFKNIVPEDVFRLRSYEGTWDFGQEVITNAGRMFLNDSELGARIEIGLVNEPSMTATWYKHPDTPDSYVIAVNAGLVTALNVIAFDIFGYGDEVDDEPLLLGHHDAAAAERVSERIAAFLEVGFPLGNGLAPSSRRSPFVEALVADAIQFLILHEFAHIVLRHDRGDVHLLRDKRVDLQIATFSIGQEHQADDLAGRLHALMRRPEGTKFAGMEFGGPSLFFGLLGLFERYTRYRDAFDSPHAHPNAYERLYRLRVAFTAGSRSGYVPVFSDGNLNLARPFAEPNPEAVRFSDAIAQSLLSVLASIEEKQLLPSPINNLFNQYCEGDLSNDKKEQFWQEIARWLFIGSPIKIIHHLAELRRSAEEQLKMESDEGHRAFVLRALALTADVVNRMRTIEDYSTKRALQRYAAAFA